MERYLVKAAFALVLVALLSCEGLYILDPIDPRLPKYTHDGNDVAGAFINGQLWKSVVFRSLHTQNSPEIVRYPDDRLVISFYGEVEERTHAIRFTLVGYDIRALTDLTKIRGLKIPLDGNPMWAEVDDGCASSVAGQLYVRTVYFQDNGSLVFSGTFGFSIETDSCAREVTYGRFDYRLDTLDFMVFSE